MRINYTKEFFDREYGWKEAYSRVWKYARPYRWRLFAGILCGFLTAGTLVPIFQLVQPAVGGIELVGRSSKAEGTVSAEETKEVRDKAEGESYDRVHEVEESAKKAVKNLPSWYPKVEKAAKRFGITIMDEHGVVQGPVILLVLVVVPIIAFVRLGLRYLNHYTLSWSGAHAMADLSCEMMAHVHRQSLQFFAKTDVGMLMSRIRNDPRTVRTILHSVISDLAEAPFEIFVSVGFVVWYAFSHDMVATLVIIAIAFPLFTIPVKAIGRHIRKWAKTSLERASLVLSRIHEVLTCIKLVKSVNTEALENTAYRKANAFLVKSTMRCVRLGGMVPIVMEMTGVSILCGFVCWCFYRDITLDQVLPMLAPLLVIYKPVKKLTKLQVTMETSLASLSRIFSLLDLDMALPEAEHPVPKPTFDHSIEFKNVSFTYDGADRPAVKNVSFVLPAGAKVAAVGATGSGKSTLGALLARFLDPTEGTVLVDGIDIREIATSDLRRLVGVVTQDAHLFNEDIAYNISYGKPKATEAEIAAAAEAANAHHFIAKRAKGYKDYCGEKGSSLSGGERQRISIARAVLKNPPVLVLDEATSALDNITERIVQDALEKLMHNRTTFAIAHRLSTIRDADLILVMRDGEIVERGRHEELYALGGVYRALCDMQNAQ